MFFKQNLIKAPQATTYLGNKLDELFEEFLVFHFYAPVRKFGNFALWYFEESSCFHVLI